METRAPLALIGLFVLAAIGAVFGFVYWLNTSGGLGKRTLYTVRFESTVSGLLTGAAVLFNGIRVGEVTALRLEPADARQVVATIAVAAGTPVRADTRVGLDFQGLTGVPVVTLEGGTGASPEPTPGGTPPLLVADPAAGQSMTLAARNMLRSLDRILGENADPLRSTIGHINTFAAALARNSDRVDGILQGLERLTGGGPAAAAPVIYDLGAPQTFPAIPKAPPGPMTVPEPTTVLLYDTQKVLVRPGGGGDPSFESARWSDSLPKLLQARIVQSFENAKFLGTVTRPIDGLTPKYQLLIDLRRFQVTVGEHAEAEIELTVKILDADGAVVAARLFHVAEPATVTNAGAAAAALDAAFRKLATELVVWTSAAL
jgi:phospholipid/cholesterol/gamma-HCH transport system substrate-binding protein